MFEIISSQHLELSSMEAEQERERQRAKELEKDGKIMDYTILTRRQENVLKT